MITGDWQIELSGVLTGTGTKYRGQQFNHEKPEGEIQDQPRPRGDSILFGRDSLSGTLLSFEYLIVGSDAADAFDLLAALRAAWQAEDERNVSGATTVLTYRRPGAPDRRVYGRPRRFTPVTLENAQFGVIPVVCDFQARDHLFYQDAVSSEVLTQVSPVSSGGLRAPLRAPLRTEPSGERHGFVTNTGAAPTPLRIRFNGPATSPSLTLVGPNIVLKLDTSIVTGEYIEIDTFAKTVLRDGVANAAGKLTRNSRYFHLPAGTSELRYQAVDATANSFVEVFWRDASYSL